MLLSPLHCTFPGVKGSCGDFAINEFTVTTADTPCIPAINGTQALSGRLLSLYCKASFGLWTIVGETVM